MNLNDPNLDFDLESQILKSKLLRAQEQQNANDKAILGYDGLVAPWQPGAGIGNALKQFSGRTRERNINDQMRGLSGEEMNRYNALQAQLATPQGVDLSDPQQMIAEAARQQGLAGQMSRLPKYRERAQEILKNVDNFPLSLGGKLQRQKFDRGMQDARHAEARNVATTAYNRQQDDKDKDFEIWKQKEQWKLDNVPDEESTKAGMYTPEEKVDNEFLLKSNSNDATTILRAIETLETGGNFEAVTGPMDDFFTNFPGLPTVLAMMGMPKKKAGKSQIETVEGKVTEIAKQAMSKYGKLGNMAVQEWKIIKDAVGNLDPGAKNYKQMLAEIKLRVRRADRFAREEFAKRSGVPVEELELASLDDMLTESMKERESLTMGSDKEGFEPAVVKVHTLPNGDVWELLEDGTERKVQMVGK